jgi:hypothetical protein
MLISLQAQWERAPFLADFKQWRKKISW